MYQAQESLHAFLLNFPNRWIAWFLRFFIFPRGRTYKTPSDELSLKIVTLMTTPGESRERLSEFAYTTLEPGNALGKLQEALELAKEHAPLEKRLRQASKEGLIASEYLGLQIGEAEKAQVISKAEANSLRDYHEKVAALLAVDDFAPEELARVTDTNKAVAKKPAPKKPAAKKKASRKKAGKKKTAKA
jgi:acyl-CoA dehydrogenase